VTRLSRRCFGLSLGIAVSALTQARPAGALGRKPYGGTLRLRLPWPLDTIDPHALDDALAALVGASVADPLYALDPAGHPYPALADGFPEAVAGGVRVALRPNLLTARGVPLDARDAVASLRRAARAGAAGLLAPFGKITPDPKDPLAFSFAAADPTLLASALASPMTAIWPRGASRTRPDGTGAFLAELSRGRVLLTRNPNAARGAALLDRVELSGAADLKDALRAFEAGETDASWLGEFLHKPRPGALKYDAGPLGWVVLHTGKDAGAWGAPGVAQRLLDALPSGRLSHLGLSGASGGRGGATAWGGEAAEIVVMEGAVHLEQIAKELAATFSSPGHELRVAVRPRSEVEYRRARGRFALLLDFARSVGAGPGAHQLGVLTAASPALAAKPVLTPSGAPRDVATTLSLGVVGQLRATGAHVGALREFSLFDLGSVWRKG
jgi:peptide/nickel transport system substrate-binding protein